MKAGALENRGVVTCVLALAALALRTEAAPVFNTGSPAASSTVPPAETTPPNLLLIVVDDVGIDAVRAYGVPGQTPAPMPVLDGLVRHGMLFRNVWATPACSSTRASLLTGRYSFRHGIGMFIPPQSKAELPWDEITLPEILSTKPELGYRSALFGKWHIGNYADGPALAGFGTFSGSRANLNQGDNYYRWHKVECGIETLTEKYATTDTVDDALNYIATTPEPWFIYLPFHAAHARFRNPPEHLHSDVFDERSPRCDKRQVYRAMIEAVDTELGRLFEGMGERLERTNIVFTGDNGPPPEVLPPPLRPGRGKLSPYEDGLRVPLVIAGPAVRKPGSETDALVNLTDLYATLVELAGFHVESELPAGAGTDSISLAPYLRDPDTPELRDYLYSALIGTGLEVDWGRELHAIRNKRFKLIHRVHPTQRYELYDLDRDPGETRNLMRAAWDKDLEEEFINLAAALEAVLGS